MNGGLLSDPCLFQPVPQTPSRYLFGIVLEEEGKCKFRFVLNQTQGSQSSSNVFVHGIENAFSSSIPKIDHQAKSNTNLSMNRVNQIAPVGVQEKYVKLDTSTAGPVADCDSEAQGGRSSNPGHFCP